MVYLAAEDSELLISCLDKSLKNKQVLEVGCGSGVVSVAAAKLGAKVTAVDIDPKAVEHTKALAKKEHVSLTVVESNLFSELKDQFFDCMLCNPPYLPNEVLDPDIALDGGREGWEFIAKFLPQAKMHLHEHGKILLLYSNRTNKDKVEKLIFDEGFRKVQVKELAVGLGEILYVDELTPYLARGKRGFTYTEIINGKTVLIKQRSPESDVDTLANEVKFLKILNKNGIGPSFISYSDGKLVREFVAGERIGEFLTHCTKKQALEVVKQVFTQCYTMDLLGINKFEMTNPYKHILITKNPLRCVMIDFERCKYTKKPKNVTQVAQYFAKQELHSKLAECGVSFDTTSLLTLATSYKHEGYKKESFTKILELFS